MWFKLSYWLLQSLFVSGSVQTSTINVKLGKNCLLKELKKAGKIIWLFWLESLFILFYFSVLQESKGDGWCVCAKKIRWSSRISGASPADTKNRRNSSRSATSTVPSGTWPSYDIQHCSFVPFFYLLLKITSLRSIVEKWRKHFLKTFLNCQQIIVALTFAYKMLWSVCLSLREDN